MLLVFGAEVNILNNMKKSPLDLTLNDEDDNLEKLEHTTDELVKLLKDYSAKPGNGSVETNRRPKPKLFRRVSDYVLGGDEKEAERNSSAWDDEKVRSEGDDWYTKISKLNFELEINLKRILEDVNLSLMYENFSLDKAAALGMQMKEMAMLEMAGCRMLFLDGGGMRGLLEIDILCQIEKRSGRKITELFDWIIGTSIGAIIAVLLVHGKI